MSFSLPKEWQDWLNSTRDMDLHVTMGFEFLR